MIFDMSPISPHQTPLSHARSLSRPSSRESLREEPFMYAMPTFRLSPPWTSTRLRTKQPRQNLIPTRNNSNSKPFGSEFLERPSPSPPKRHRPDTAHDSSPAHGDRKPKTKKATTKIIGFMPLNEQPPSAVDQTPRLSINPPRKSSFNSSPWILPGRSDSSSHREDVSYSQTDPSAFEFQRDLMRRTDHQNPTRFKNLHPQCF
ncbi:hypothetical protein D9619_007021 [Psilocybe cf. subviscida]|uniref:Uncharacterized protein n=1 Tax=Psilocybe cf. subviscida TaxID=2480587 RepID=A0A8H5B2M5_9AGAR|nr:hypothetical protein D9619_007021 [Psilocybe cf. subviscida]